MFMRGGGRRGIGIGGAAFNFREKTLEIGINTKWGFQLELIFVKRQNIIFGIRHFDSLCDMILTQYSKFAE